MGKQKKHAVILRSDSIERCAEGLRCAVGLTLAGDQVIVLFTQEARDFASSLSPSIARPIQTLARLGHELYLDAASSPHEEIEPTSEAIQILRSCDTSAVW